MLNKIDFTFMNGKMNTKINAAMFSKVSTMNSLCVMLIKSLKN